MIYNKEVFEYTIQSFLEKGWNLDNTLIRIKDYLYKFEDWVLPKRGKILVQRLKNTENYSLTKAEVNYKNSEIFFDVEFYPDQQIVQVIFDPIHMFQAIVSIYENTYLIRVLNLNNSELMTTVKTKSNRYSSFELHGDRIVFILYTENGRPYKLCEEIFKESKRNVLYLESRMDHQLKLIKSFLPNRTLFKSDSEYLLFSSRDSIPIRTIWEKEYGHVDFVVDFRMDMQEYILFVRRKDHQVNHELVLYNCKDLQYQVLHTKMSLRIYDIEANHSYVLIRYFNNNRIESGIISIENLVSQDIDFLKEIFCLPLMGEVHLYLDCNDDSTLLLCQDGCVSQFLYCYNPMISSRLSIVKSSTTITDIDPSYFHETTVYVNSSKDETKIPLTIYWKGMTNNIPKNKPGIIYVYGAYGAREQKGNLDPLMVAMLELGFVYCVAHVRGGGYLGREWHKSGKLLNKWNSIYDFLDCSQYLIDEKIISVDNLSLISSSAGGIIAGASLNEEPKLFRSMLLASPFVDPYNTMLYKSDYLSHLETGEWGDPSNDLITRNYIHSYSPLQNTNKARGSRTKLFVVCGENDKQVSNEDVISWLLRLKKLGITSHLEINKQAGHGGLPFGDIKSLTEIVSNFLYSSIN